MQPEVILNRTFLRHGLSVIGTVAEPFGPCKHMILQETEVSASVLQAAARYWFHCAKVTVFGGNTNSRSVQGTGVCKSFGSN